MLLFTCIFTTNGNGKKKFTSEITSEKCLIPIESKSNRNGFPIVYWSIKNQNKWAVGIKYTIVTI